MAIRSALWLAVPALLGAQAPANPAPAPGAQAQAQAQAPNGPAGTISFDNLHHNFGRISPDKKVTHKFKVANTGAGYLSITNVQPSCGCTYTMLGKWSLAPGEATEIEAQFNPQGQRGMVRKSILVVSNDPKQGQTTLTLEADVVPEVMPSQENVYFVDATRTSTLHQAVRYSSGSGGPLKVTEAKAPGAPYLKLAWRQDGKDGVVDVTLDGKMLPKGAQRGVETVTVQTDNARVPTVRLNVVWSLRAVLAAEPVTLTWLEQPAGTAHPLKLVLKHVDGKPFRITGAKPSDPNLKVEGLDQASAAKHEFTVVLDAKMKAGRYGERIVFSTDDPDQPEIIVPASIVLK